jgi:catechol 2,3-dioxygenase
MTTQDLTAPASVADTSDSPTVVIAPRVHNLSHVELRTPDLEASLQFFTNILGMQETAREGQSVYLRAWGEWTHHSIVLTEAPEAGVVHIGYRVAEPTHVEKFADRLRRGGVDVTRVDGGAEPGQGDAIRFQTPSDHTLELFYDFARVPGSAPSRLSNMPNAHPGRGIAVPRIDHVNVMAPDVRANREWLEDNLGLKTRELLRLPDGTEPGAWLSAGPLSHDYAMVADPYSSGRLHHVAFWLDSVQDLFRAAEIYHENAIKLEAGPGKHGGTQGTFIYAREPGGNRIELYTGGYLALEPDFETVVWGAEQAEYMLVWVGMPMSEEFLTQGSPHAT